MDCKVVLLQQQCSARARLDQGRGAGWWSQGCCEHRSDPMSPQHERRPPPPPRMAAGRVWQHRGCPVAPCTIPDAARRAVHPNRDRIRPLEWSQERLTPVQLIVMKEGQGVMGQAVGHQARRTAGGTGGDGAGGRQTHPRDQHQTSGTNTSVPDVFLGGGGWRSPGACPALQGEAGTGK